MKNMTRRAMLAMRGLRASREAKEKLRQHYRSGAATPMDNAELEEALTGISAMQGSSLNVALEIIEELEVAHAALTLTVARMSVYLAHLWEYTLAEAPEGVEPLAPTEEFIELAHEAAAMYEQEKEQLSDE